MHMLYCIVCSPFVNAHGKAQSASRASQFKDRSLKPNKQPRSAFRIFVSTWYGTAKVYVNVKIPSSKTCSRQRTRMMGSQTPSAVGAESARGDQAAAGRRKTKRRVKAAVKASQKKNPAVPTRKAEMKPVRLP